VRQITIPLRDPRRFAEVVGPARAEALAVDAAGEAIARLAGQAVINVNSTAAGGGVAEMLHVLLGYARAAGIDARWLVIDGNAEFFAVTKRVHNRLYGAAGDGGALDESAHAVYEDGLASDAHELATSARQGDIVVLHDPQTAGLAEHAKALDCHVVWRCHVGIDSANDHSRQAWEFLRGYLEDFVDHYVMTHAGFAPSWVPRDRLSVIWPSIDPFAPKNQFMSEATVEAILSHVGMIAGSHGDTSFERLDGAPGRVESFCDIIRTGAPPGPDVPLVVQVSRWDAMKDMAGVMKAFGDHVDSGRDAHLVLAGPVVTAVADDPEGGQILQECWRQWRELPHAVRHRVQLVCLPMHDREENAAIVNALQRHATVVTQKSLAEGFGLTVAEAMVKGTPVVASAVGGIVDQVVHEQTGLLIEDPHDLESFGAAVCRILDDPDLARRLGEGGRQRALEIHLGDVHLERWAQVIAAVLDGVTQG
jgi:trehalose synthase